MSWQLFWNHAMPALVIYTVIVVKLTMWAVDRYGHKYSMGSANQQQGQESVNPWVALLGGAMVGGELGAATCACGHFRYQHASGSQYCCVNVGDISTGTVTGCTCQQFQAKQ